MLISTNMDIMKKIWNSVMNSDYNPISNVQNMEVRHLVMQILAFMWSAVFSIYIVNSIGFFKYTAIAHALLIAAIFVTAFVFQTAKKKPEVFDHKFFRGKDGEHD
jgi:hypothetical protein